MDPFDKVSVWEPTPGNADAIRKNLGYARRFAEHMNFGAMKPRPELASSGYCLANPGAEYLIYQANSGEPVSVELMAGTYHYQWFNPATGLTAGSARLEAREGKREFKAPFEGESVLYLAADSSAKSSESHNNQ